MEKLQGHEMEMYKARVRARQQQKEAVEGFGEKHSITQWSKRLGVPKTSLWKYLRKGLTIEEVCELRGIEYNEVINGVDIPLF